MTCHFQILLSTLRPKVKHRKTSHPLHKDKLKKNTRFVGAEDLDIN